ncbi:threonine--tRNA ligase [Candidatus Bathyarchaeota archaeon]|nr:MAG: threonine--tRNA ligase [Candidatus Bathyarchaeota archaeon]
MKILLIHADEFNYEAKQKALKKAEELKEDERSYTTSEVLVVFCAVEKVDEKNLEQVLKKTSDSIEEVAKKVKVENVVIYPYAHLSSDLASPDNAIKLLNQLCTVLAEKKFKVKLAPFGWYKSFKLSCKGHPLSELSRTIVPEEVEHIPLHIKNEYKILTRNMELFNPEDYVFQPFEEDFKFLVLKEALGEELKGGVKPRYLDYCKKFGFEWESFSDLGHMRYGPEANLMFELVADYAGMLADSLGVPVYHVRGTNMFNLAVPAVSEHAKLFGGRLYEVKTDKRRLILRYAACHQQFAMLKDWVISYKDLPFGVYELADSYRFEQEGELLLCFRVRKLHMPDLHLLCKNLEEAQEYALLIHKKVYEEIKKLGRNYVSLYNTTKSYFEKNKEFFRKLLEIEDKPVLLCFVPENVFYWVLNIEYNIIDELNRPREIATFQIDVGNAKRFNIQYVDVNGAKVNPVIIHTALIGTVERYIFTLFDSAVKNEKNGKPPMLPVWLSPTQVRIVPVSEKQFNFSLEILEKLEKEKIRVDLDDSSETLSKKIMKAETSWVPYVVVVGEEQIRTEKFDVRIRETGERKKMSLEELVKEVKRKINGYPWKPLPFPRKLSRRPVY